MDNLIKNAIQNSIDVKEAILQNESLLQTIEQVAQTMIATLKRGNAVFWCGNGGSAADAQHLAAELSGRFYYDRQPLPSEALHCNTSYLTAVANDYGYELVYSRLIAGLGKKGDLLVGLSTSGNSQNILNAFEKAKELGITTIAMTGETGGKMAPQADFLINIPSTDTPRIQESHITIGHILCEIIEATLFPKS
ncbi:MAG: D-sedoheptulose 7-phosphate isomerase [Paludibacteraceae bacterium]|nr:D-sedoheptulose 7-phosphate isomerase [Paludibacteraceae bacterium]